VTAKFGGGRNARRLKRCADIVLAGAGLVALSPLLAAIGGAIRITMGAPVIYRQPRPGLGGEIFIVVKFRTMRATTDASGRDLSDAERITRLGELLRRTSLDELPQLWNVLLGEMSLVGPRPLLVEWLPIYTAEQARRHNVRPGLTGWAQINGRNDIPYSQRIALDVWYVDHWSVWLDLRIILRTPLTILGMLGSRPVENRAALDDMGLLAASA
jgi:lipopolysaccharide/colanic/teichoic acid biosynthesis glycosyltransferase